MTSSHPSHLSQPCASRRIVGPAAATLAAALLLAACGDATQGTGTPMADQATTSSSTSTATDPATTATQSPTTTATSVPAISPTSTAPRPGSTATPAAGRHNAADVAFAAGMVPHHQQAVVMADMARRHGGTDEFVRLAAKVKAAQQPEITQMSGWLVGWGEKVPDAMNHAGHSSTGMMSQKDLDAMIGSGFEGMWLTMMARHHEGALATARDEVAHGQNAEATRLARSIITSQTAEIATMKKMADSRAG